MNSIRSHFYAFEWLFHKSAFLLLGNKYKVLLWGIVLSLFFGFPDLHLLVYKQGGGNGIHIAVSDHIFDGKWFSHLPVNSHESKLFYRIFIPLLIKITGGSILWIYVGQFVLGILTLLFFHRVLHALFKDVYVANALFLSCCFILPLRLPFIQVNGWLDAFPISMLLLACFFNNRLLQMMLVFASLWCDERAFIASGGVFFYHLWGREIKISVILSSPVLIALFLYVSLRLYVRYLTGFEIPAGNASGLGPIVLLDSLPKFLFDYYRVYEGLLYIVFVAITLLFYQRNYFFAFSILACMCLQIAAALFVLDVGRSLCYLITLLPIVFKIASNILSRKEAFIVLMICFLLPTNGFLFIPPAQQTNGNSVLWEFYKLYKGEGHNF
jgi:hypothetical protein